MLKLAICLSGAPRFQDRGFFRQLEAMKGEWEADLFIRTWKTDQFGRTPKEFEKWLVDNGLPSNCHFKVTQVLDDVAEHHSKPINLSHRVPTNHSNFINFWYNVVQTNNLRKEYQQQTGTEYDLVVRMRTDVCPHADESRTVDGSFNLHDYEEIAKTHMVNARYFGDIFLFGSPTMYDRFVQFYDHLDVLSANNTSIHPEESLEQYFKDTNIPYKQLDVIMTPMGRADEYGSRHRL
jgi:hypothetical protein